MEYFGFAGSDAVARGRAEIKSRLLSSAPLRAPPAPVRQEPAEPDTATHPEGIMPPPAGERSAAVGVSPVGDGEASEAPSAEVEWIEPVFADGSAEEDVQTEAVVDGAAAPDPVPAAPAANGSAAGAPHLEETRVLPASPRPLRFWWGRRPASTESTAGAAAQSKENAGEGDALANEVAALRRTLAAERAAAAERIADLEASLAAAPKAGLGEGAARSRKAAVQREAAIDEIAALRLGFAAELEAAAEEIAALRRTLAAEREAAADEIAMLRTILAAQQEAAAARTTRLKAILGAAATSALAASD